MAVVVDALNTRDVLDAATSEKEFMQTVIDRARLLGFLVYHTHDSRRSAAGFPDLLFIRGRRVIVAELKTERGKPSDAQLAWLNAFRQSGRVEAYLWKPSDWPQIERVLV